MQPWCMRFFLRSNATVSYVCCLPCAPPLLRLGVVAAPPVDCLPPRVPIEGLPPLLTPPPPRPRPRVAIIAVLGAIARLAHALLDGINFFRELWFDGVYAMTRWIG